MRQLLRIRDARVFLFGWSVSVFGDWAIFIALGVWMKDLTDSNSAAGLVFFALALPSLLSPLAGLLVDRLSRRKVMIATYSVESVMVLSLLFVHDRGDAWIIYAVAAFYGAAGTLAAAARSAFMTVILPRDLLGEANGLFQTVREGLRLIAPLVGAAIYASVGGGAVAVVISLLLLKVDEPRFAREEHHFMEELLAGARHIARTLPLRQIVVATGLCLLFVGFSETVIFAVIDQGLHRSTSFFGVLSSLQGVGAIAGGVTAARILRRVGDVKLVGFGMGLFAVGELSFVSSSLPLVLVGIAVAGAGLAWFIVGFATAIQLRSPARLQGRVAGAAETLIGTPQTVSIAVGAALVTVIDYRLLTASSCLVTAGTGIYLLSRRAVIPADVADEPALAA
jgi:MFS family permease